MDWLQRKLLKYFLDLVEYTKSRYVIPGSNSEEMIPDAVKYPMLSVLLLNEVKKHENMIKEHDNYITEMKQLIENLQLENKLQKDKYETDIQQLKTEIEQIKQMIRKGRNK